MRALHLAARHGRWCLVLGLLAGLSLPGLAQAMRPWLPWLIALLLLLSAYRIGPRAAIGNLSDIGGTLRRVALFQCAAPLVAIAVLWAVGMLATPWGLVIVLVLAAPPVTGSPNFTILMGHDPAAAMRQLLVGTALLPLTVLPVLFLLPGLGAIGDVLASALRLLAVIAGAVGLAFALRAMTGALDPDRRAAVDGASAIVLAVVVVGLMSAVNPALHTAPLQLLGWLGFAMALNLGLQIAANRALAGADPAGRVGISVTAGNRNIALFLVSLPAGVMDPVLLFIGCYQVPMYLTPILMRRILR